VVIMKKWMVLDNRNGYRAAKYRPLRA